MGLPDLWTVFGGNWLAAFELAHKLEPYSGSYRAKRAARLGASLSARAPRARVSGQVSGNFTNFIKGKAAKLLIFQTMQPIASVGKFYSRRRGGL
jgi:hypothetical protein